MLIRLPGQPIQLVIHVHQEIIKFFFSQFFIESHFTLPLRNLRTNMCIYARFLQSIEIWLRRALLKDVFNLPALLD
ncbi:hypothetical protein VL13_26440 [Burkholderia lata]|nr:hypothetical protein VL13_26440 [Burkholderia lata]